MKLAKIVAAVALCCASVANAGGFTAKTSTDLNENHSFTVKENIHHGDFLKTHEVDFITGYCASDNKVRIVYSYKYGIKAFDFKTTSAVCSGYNDAQIFNVVMTDNKKEGYKVFVHNTLIIPFNVIDLATQTVISIIENPAISTEGTL